MRLDLGTDGWLQDHKYTCQDMSFPVLKIQSELFSKTNLGKKTMLFQDMINLFLESAKGT